MARIRVHLRDVSCRDAQTVLCGDEFYLETAMYAGVLAVKTNITSPFCIRGSESRAFDRNETLLFDAEIPNDRLIQADWMAFDQDFPKEWNRREEWIEAAERQLTEQITEAGLETGNPWKISGGQAFPILLSVINHGLNSVDPDDQLCCAQFAIPAFGPAVEDRAWTFRANHGWWSKWEYTVRYRVTREGNPAVFHVSFENGQAGLRDTIESSANIGGYFATLRPECSSRIPAIDGWNATSHSGSTALMYSGTAHGGPVTYCRYQAFPVQIPVTASTQLIYWLFPQQDNGRYVGLDFRCTDGTTLRDSGATDARGHSMHPACGHGGDIPLNAWTPIRCEVGRWLAGKTVDMIWVSFERDGSIGPYRGYLDDIVIMEGDLP